MAYINYQEAQWTFKNDKNKTIDYVLVWGEHSQRATSKEAYHIRAKYEANLQEEGLELENHYAEDTGLHFIKIYAPLDILKRYAEILHFRMPLKDSLNRTVDGLDPEHKKKRSWLRKCCPIFNCCEISQDAFPNCVPELSETYSRAREYLFDEEAPGFFTPAQKARVCQFILQRTLYADDGTTDVFKFGINRLLLSGIYCGAYPLHDDDFDSPESLRYRFYQYWARFKNCCRQQPADYMRQYFGVRTALYFVWLGYYVCMLIPAAIVGVICFGISMFSLHNAAEVDDVCSGKIDGVICPKCDYYCKFKKMSDICFRSKLQFIFDNSTSVFYAIFISFWATIFMECWKRYSAEITLRWDLSSIDDNDENPRPEYAAKLSQLDHERRVSHKLNFITNAQEPHVSFWKYLFPGKVLSMTTMLLLISMALAAVIAVTLYHTFAMSIVPQRMITSITATTLNLMCILIFSPIYARLALFLTEMEMPRTQREFDGSLTIKLYVLEFINHYASIFYIALFKGKFIGPPSGYFRIFGARKLECGVGGCMIELTQQLAVITIGKRLYKSLSGSLRPVLKHQIRKRTLNLEEMRDEDEEIYQWEKDYFLDDMKPPLLLPEYIDMVLQYGFVTIFVSAFPLVPLFALINNIFEIRIDAKKYLIYHRRPTMRRTKDIGVWFDILNFISCLAIFTNGFIIAFTSNFIPKLVYSYSRPGHSMKGFINSSLSYVAIADLDMKGMPNTTHQYCRYFDHREPPWSENKYEETKMFWILLAARLAFFILFENVIVAAIVVVKWLIPDIPEQVKYQMRRRHYLINEMIISHETASSKGTRIDKHVYYKMKEDKEERGLDKEDKKPIKL